MRRNRGNGLGVFAARHNGALKLGAASLLCAGTLTFGACADGDKVGPNDDIEGIPLLGQRIAPLAAACTFSNGVVTQDVASGETVVISRRSVDSALLLNGDPCLSSGAVVKVAGSGAAIAKRIVVATTGSAGVVLDYLGGTFLPGYGTGASALTGVSITGSTYTLSVRGSRAVDAITLGALGLSFDANAVLDVGFADAAPSAATVSALDGADVVTAAGDQVGAVRGVGNAFPNAASIYGGAGNDTLTGGAGDDTLSGGEGNDTFIVLDTTDGEDTFVGGAGADTVDYSRRTTAIFVSVGHATVPDIANTDYGLACTAGATPSDPWTPPGGLTGPGIADDGAITFTTPGSCDPAGCNPLDDAFTSEGDTVGDDVETVVGGSGDDFLYGACGSETLKGGNGNDTLWGGNGGNDTLYGDAGNDVLLAGFAVDGRDDFNGGAGTDLVSYQYRTDFGVTVTLDVTANDGATAQSEGDNLRGDIEVIWGTALADSLTGGANNDTIDGGPGNDTINGLAGNDTLYGNDGVDTIDGGAGDDTLYGDAGADVLTGGLGNDTFHGGTGDDVQNGGDGNDTFVAGDDAGGDTFNCGAGTDFIDYSAQAGAITVTMGDSTANDGAASENDDVGSTCENLTTGDGGSTVTGNALANVLIGGTDVDTLSGGDGDDTITGGGDDDVLDGGNGNDAITAGDGDDTVTGGAGNDSILGGAGADDLSGDDGDDVLRGGDGDDALDGGAGDDTVYGDADDDSILCGAGEGDIGVFDGDDSNVAGGGTAGDYDTHLCEL
ncbi:MAG: hypothetical protein JNJ59_25070 [Deltaproteobacteria bacterium]|nr:hypothetical protein [Deltaproteobacteria bacterium]